MTALVLMLGMLAQPAAPGPAIEGVVMHATTAAPVVHARVLVAPAGETGGGTTLTSTDDRGRFAVANLAPGRYRIIADRDGFVRTLVTASVAGRETTRVSVALTPTGVITGRVIDARGTPVARAFVRAAAAGHTYEAQTNDLGEYRIFDVPPGSYIVSGAPYLAPRIEGTMLIRPGPPSPYSMGEGQAMLFLTRMLQLGDYIDPIALTREVYTPVFYPGTTDQAEAAAIEVAPGATIGGVDLTVVRSPAPAAP